MGALEDMEKAKRKRVNTKSYIPREAKKESYTAKYHRETLKQGKQLEENGSTTTVRSVGVESKGMVYNVPAYDREKKVVDASKAKFRAKEDIKTGKVAGYSSDWGVPIKEHPANILARIEHKSIVEKKK